MDADKTVTATFTTITAVAVIPTLSRWGISLLTALLALMALISRRYKRFRTLFSR